MDKFFLTSRGGCCIIQLSGLKLISRITETWKGGCDMEKNSDFVAGILVGGLIGVVIGILYADRKSTRLNSSHH